MYMSEQASYKTVSVILLYTFSTGGISYQYFILKLTFLLTTFAHLE